MLRAFSSVGRASPLQGEGQKFESSNAHHKKDDDTSVIIFFIIKRKEFYIMEIKIVEKAANVESDILVVNLFEGEKTTDELANKYAIEEDNFKGKFGETYLLQTYGNAPYRKVLVLGLGKKEEFCPNKLREAVAKAIKKCMQMEAKKVSFSLTGIDFDYSEQFTMGAYIADYKFDKYKSEKKDKRR